MPWGTASYYYCSPGTKTTACGHCSDFSGQFCAYPDISGHPPDYAYYCRYPGVAATCGHLGEFTNRCTNNYSLIYINDHGPGASCHYDSTCISGYHAYRMLDLTASLYFALGGGGSGTLYMSFYPCPNPLTHLCP